MVDGDSAACALPRYKVIGFLGGDFGLGQAARNTLWTLEASGRRPLRVPVESRRARWGRDGLRRARSASAARLEAADINLFHMNPIELARHRGQWRDRVDPLAGRNVAVPFWELPLAPATWLPALDALDAILAPTRFVLSACSAAVGPERVLHYPQAVFLPGGIRPASDAWGLRPDATRFIVSFDLGSAIDRKNPWAALEAFRQAFPSDPGVQLVVKMKPSPRARALREAGEELRARAGADPRIRIVERTLDYAEVLSLYASCDVMLSLHRSEGLGLHCMEAMALGKVVVATNWSGNTDFMTAENSVPVGYRLVPVATRHSVYVDQVGRPGQVWAEADLGEAVQALRVLHGNRDRRRALGSRASQDMEACRSEALSGAVFQRLEGFLRGRPGRGVALLAGLRRTRLRHRWARLKRKASSVVLRIRAAAGR